jgi:hypothetical protein
MLLRFEVWTLPTSATFERRFAVPAQYALAGSSGVKELSGWTDETLLVPANWPDLAQITGSTGSLIRAFAGPQLIDEFEAARVAIPEERPSRRAITGPQINGVVETIGIYPKTDRDGAQDWKWGTENILPPLGLEDLGNIKEEWEIVLLGERYQLDLFSATAGTFTLTAEGNTTAAIAFDATASTITSALEALAGITEVSVQETDVDSRSFWIVFETPKDLSANMTLDDSGLTGSATLTKYNNGFDTSTDPTFTVTVDGDTTEALAWDISDDGLEGSGVDAGSGLQGLSTVQDVTVSGSGTFGDPWVITFYSPADISSFSVTFSGTHLTTKILEGGYDPSPITISKPIDAEAGDPDQHGTYGVPALEVRTTPLDTGADWTLRVNAWSGFAGSQIVLNVIPGETYSNISIRVQPTVSSAGLFIIVVRDIFGGRIARKVFTLTSGSYQTLTIDSLTIPAGVNQVIFRVAVDPANAGAFYVNWQGATFLTGDPEATGTKIIRQLLEAAQTRGTATFLDPDFTDTTDTAGNAVTPMSFTAWFGENAHLGKPLETLHSMGWEWRVKAKAVPSGGNTHDLQLWAPGSEIDDQTTAAGGASVTAGGKIEDAEVVKRIPRFSTMLAWGPGGLTLEDTDATLVTNMGRRERIVDAEQLGSNDSLQALLDAHFAEQADNLAAATATVLGSDSSVPLTDYEEGSKIWWQFPGILAKEARRVRRITWAHQTPTRYVVQGSTVFSPDAALAKAVDFLLDELKRRPGRGGGTQTALLASGGQRTGAHIHLGRSTTQTIAVSGEEIAWANLSAVITSLAFGTPSFPATEVTIQEPGYYNVAVLAGWDTWEAGGSVWIVRVRGGAETTVWPPDDDPGLWTSTDGRLFEGVAPAIPFLAGDQVKVYVDHDDSSTHDLVSASLALYLVDVGSARRRYVDVVLADGPLAYWRFDEASGTTAVDSAGHASGPFNGTYVNAPTLGAVGVMRDGSGSPSVDLNGSNQGVNGQDWPVMDFASGAFSFEAWFNGDALDATTQILIHKREPGLSKLGWEFGVVAAGVFFTDDTDIKVVSSAAVANDTDYHTVVTFDGTSTTRLYLNGALVDTDTGGLTITANTEIVSIGVDAAEPGFRFDGQLDEVTVWDRALTAAEIAEHYTVGVGG